MSRIWNRSMVVEMLGLEARSLEALDGSEVLALNLVESRARSIMWHRHGVDDVMVSRQDVETAFDRGLFAHVATWRPRNRPVICLRPGPLFGLELGTLVRPPEPADALRVLSPQPATDAFDGPTTLTGELVGWDPDRRAWLYA